MKKLIFIFMLLLTVSSVFAQAEEINNQIITPVDGWRYNLKRFGEGFGSMLRFRAESKVEYNLQLAQNRLDELEVMDEGKKEMYQEYLMNQYQKHINKAEGNAQQSQFKEQMQDKIQTRLQEHTQQMNQIRAEVSSELQQKIQLRIQEMESIRTRLQQNKGGN